MDVHPGQRPQGQLSLGAVDLRKGYAGYEFAAEIAPSGAKYQVRNRFYDAGMGRWTRRDPLGYVDGMGLYTYVDGRPIAKGRPIWPRNVVGLRGTGCARAFSDEPSV